MTYLEINRNPSIPMTKTMLKNAYLLTLKKYFEC